MAPFNFPEFTLPLDSSTEKVALLEGNTGGKRKKEVLSEGYFYDITDFIERHPGGRVIEFYTETGEDATQAIQQFHKRSLTKVNGILKSFKRRPANETDYVLDSEKWKRHEALTKDFNELHAQLEKEGYFEPSIAHVLYRIVELMVLLGIACVLVTYDSFLLKAIGSICFGMFGGRCGWLMHEGGHNSLTGYPKIDKIIGKFVIGLAAAGSLTWWKSHHNRHHAMPQRLSRDVDLEGVPFFVFNAKAIKKDQNGKGFFIKYQAFLFTAIDGFLVLLFWAVYLHPRVMIKRRQYLEMFFTLCHYGLFYHLGIYGSLFAMWFAGSYIFINLALSHTHLPVTTEPTHWVEYSLVHTMDIEPSWFMNWWMGYLNCQIEHHLFPTMPQFRQPQIRHRVRALAEKHGLPYLSVSYFEAVKRTLRNLHEVSQELQTK